MNTTLTAPPGRSRTRWGVAAAALAVLAAGGTAAAMLAHDQGPSAATPLAAGVISGHFDVIESSAFGDGAPCSGTGKHALIKDGTPITVEDGAGAVLGSGTLTNGRGFRDGYDKVVGTAFANEGTASNCRFDFSVAVPGSAHYELKVTVFDTSISHEDLLSRNWTLDFATDRY